VRVSSFQPGHNWGDEKKDDLTVQDWSHQVCASVRYSGVSFWIIPLRLTATPLISGRFCRTLPTICMMVQNRIPSFLLISELKTGHSRDHQEFKFVEILFFLILWFLGQKRFDLCFFIARDYCAIIYLEKFRFFSYKLMCKAASTNDRNI
jgi:hypothetical protein